VEYTTFHLRYSGRYDTSLPNITEIAPLTLLVGSAPDLHHQQKALLRNRQQPLLQKLTGFTDTLLLQAFVSSTLLVFSFNLNRKVGWQLPETLSLERSDT